MRNFRSFSTLLVFHLFFVSYYFLFFACRHQYSSLESCPYLHIQRTGKNIAIGFFSSKFIEIMCLEEVAHFRVSTPFRALKDWPAHYKVHFFREKGKIQALFFPVTNRRRRLSKVNGLRLNDSLARSDFTTFSYFFLVWEGDPMNMEIIYIDTFTLSDCKRECHFHCPSYNYATVHVIRDN